MLEKAFTLFSKPLRYEVSKLGWKKPTLIQRQVIPIILNGDNVLLIAPTGTGKTEAAIFPVFEQFIQKRSKKKLHGISILYITPLRALNRDIYRRIVEIGKHLEINVQLRHGDTPQRARRLQALSPPDMLITTPETLQAILPGRRIGQHLRNVHWVIIDEIHELASDKRGVQLSIALERVRELTNREFQRIGLSATIGSPEFVAKFLVGINRTVKIIKTETMKALEVVVESPKAEPDDRKIAQKLLISPESVSRIRRLLDFITKYKSTLIFTNTRQHAEALASRIYALQPDCKIGVHHGSLSRSLRIDTEEKLKDGTLKAVICTSSLELGIDIGHIEFVAQYMSPRRVTRLVQRIGRSGHVIKGVSRGSIIATWPDDILEAGIISQFALEGRLERLNIPTNPLDVLAHQIVGLCLDWGRISIEDVYRIVQKTWSYRHLEMDALIDVVYQLESVKKIWFDENIIKKRAPHVYNYYFSNLSMIPNVKRYDVVDFLRRKRIGTLDQEFIAENGKAGQEFIMHGQTWKILSVDEENSITQVEPVYQSLGAVPSWKGEIIPVPFDIAQQVGRLRKEVAEKLSPDHGNALQVLEKYQLNEDALTKAIETLRKHLQAEYPMPTHRKILIEGFESYVIIHACFGNLVNEAIAKTLVALLSARLSVSVTSRSDPYRIALITPTYLNPMLVRDELLKLKPEEMDFILDTTLKRAKLFTWRFWNVAKRFGIVEKDAEYRSSYARMLVKIFDNTPVSRETLNEIYTEKMDVENARKILSLVQNGEINVAVVNRSVKYSPLALPILDRIAPQDMLKLALPSTTIIEIVKERLNLKEVRLVCILNADYNGIRKVRTLPDVIKCPNCGLTLIATTYSTDSDLIKIVKKKKAKRNLTQEEEKIWLRAWRNASIIQTYGKRGALTLAARGVGPITAVRILRRHHRTEDDFYLDLLRAEREYVRTRVFWDK
jgi:ATP-dependent Lhr-like helicase